MSPHPSGLTVASTDLDELLAHVAQLHLLNISTVPLCRPLGVDWCSVKWHPAPCEERGKRPLVVGFPARASHHQPLEEALAEVRAFYPCNLGIVVPGGAVVVEGDSPEAEQEILELAGAEVTVAPARERRPTRGRGFLFRDDQTPPMKRCTGRGRAEAIDILPGGSLFVVAGVHATGHIISWVPGRAPWETPIPYLPDALRALAPAEHPTAGHRSPSLHQQDQELVAAVAPRVAFLITARREIRLLWEGEKSGGDTSASGIDFSLAVELLRARVPPDQVAPAIIARPGAHRTTADYAWKTVNAALEKLR